MTSTIILAFTGPRDGMQFAQYNQLRYQLRRLRPTLHTILHGGCIGADGQFHQLLMEEDLLHCTEIYWSDRPGQRAALAGLNFVRRQHDPDDPLARNEIMARRCDLLIATPAQTKEKLRSGTWTTIRRAKRFGKRIMYIWPDGTAHEVETIDKRLRIR